MYAQGLGVSQDYSEAVRWFRLSADQGYDVAQFNLGLMYAQGDGVKQDYGEAQKWFRLAADQGLQGAIDALKELEVTTPNPPASTTRSKTSLQQPDIRSQGNQTLQSFLDELNAMTGLARVKTEIYQLLQFVRVQEMRSKKGLLADDVSLHSVFFGSPGTGKTTVARLYAKMLHSMGLLSKGHLVETDRTGLVAGYIGQTELKTDAKINEALGAFCSLMKRILFPKAMIMVGIMEMKQ